MSVGHFARQGTRSLWKNAVFMRMYFRVSTGQCPKVIYVFH